MERLVESIAKDAPVSKTQKILYGLFTVGGQYIWTRANRYITEQGWGELDEVTSDAPDRHGSLILWISATVGSTKQGVPVPSSRREILESLHSDQFPGLFGQRKVKRKRGKAKEKGKE